MILCFMLESGFFFKILLPESARAHVGSGRVSAEQWDKDTPTQEPDVRLDPRILDRDPSQNQEPDPPKPLGRPGAPCSGKWL